ncbi:hypothetical protein E2C01_001139 [Portunus trituberculatus]|uniref:Uncharacterized protein n=1 Tax=Portunus trituberculatus TaxID=210409 RepID=A0A5B7CGU8_PORTR|nr:hypothetical protein [Portunus trituberculatus]
MVGHPSKTGSGLWPMACPHLEPQPRSLPPTLLVVAVDIFTERGCKPHPNQLDQPWAGTLVSLRTINVAAIVFFPMFASCKGARPSRAPPLKDPQIGTLPDFLRPTRHLLLPPLPNRFHQPAQSTRISFL